MSGCPGEQDRDRDDDQRPGISADITRESDIAA
jgi:hypothetical protein